MDIMKGKWKKMLFHKAWERCRSFGLGGKKSPRNLSLTKSKSWSSTTSTNNLDLMISSQEEEEEANNKNTINAKRKKKILVAPDGCFSVYVGPEKQRFVVKTKFANHPLFKMLLEDAELEYGFTSEGPLLLPCEVELFYKVLAEMESSGDEIITQPPLWSPLILCSPSRRSTSAIGSADCKGLGVYRLLSPSRLLKLNSA